MNERQTCLFLPVEDGLCHFALLYFSTAGVCPLHDESGWE